MKIRNLALLSCVLGCIILSGCQSAPSPQKYVIGPSYFEKGDSIVLTDVQSELGTFEIGDTVTIEGKYNLAERSEAKLLLTITQTEGDGRSTVAPSQTTKVVGEEGNFKLGINIQYKGYLHLSLRTASGKDRSLGCLYFGTKEQMEDIQDWDLARRYNK